MGDHKWWISDLRRFQDDYPGWHPTYDVRDMLQERYDANVEDWTKSLGVGAAVG